MSEPRIIKKYPNRRLYDTEESRYITLADIRRLVLEEIDFVVIDKNSQQDITRNILLQVMDHATLTDNQGREADFSHVLLVMTSNAGTREMASKGTAGIFILRPRLPR